MKMENIKWAIIPLFILAILSGCKNTPPAEEEVLRNVKINEAIENKTGVLLSELVQDDVEYIPLESKQECLLNNNPRFYANETEIIAIAENQVYVFDRQTGKFLREIGHYGNDPGGYQGTKYSYPYDEKNDLFYLGGWGPLVYFRYNSSGNLVDEITAYPNTKEPDLQNSDLGEIVTSIAPLNDTCFVGHVWNIDGKQKTKLIIFNENNHRIKTYPQYKTFEWDIFKDGLTIHHWDGWFYEHNKVLNYFERSTDTLFSVSMEELKPRYVFSEQTPVEEIAESDRFLLLQLNHEDGKAYAVFDKRENNTKVETELNGIENDVDNFIPFLFYSVNLEDELVGFQEAYLVNAWFNDNPEKAALLAPELQDLKNIQETDNPVVMIAKLKE